MGRAITTTLAALSVAALLGAAGPALAVGNLAAGGKQLPDLKIDTSTNKFSQDEYDLETGVYYRLNITADDGADDLAIVMPELFRNSWIDQIVVNKLEIKVQDPYSLEFDDAGTFNISFVVLRPGVYEYWSPGQEDKGLKGKFVVK
jgi:hypothetical protein